MQRRNVDLPEPDGPSRHRTSLGADLQRDALEDLEAPEGLVDLLGPDHRLAHRPSPDAPGASTVACRNENDVRRRRCSGVSGRVREAPRAYLALEVVLPDREHRGHDQVPDARHEQERDLTVVHRVDELRRVEQLAVGDDAARATSS